MFGIWLQMNRKWFPKCWCWFLENLTSVCWLFGLPMPPEILWTNLRLVRLVKDSFVVGVLSCNSCALKWDYKASIYTTPQA